jgi:hypothetical protein
MGPGTFLQIDFSNKCEIPPSLVLTPMNRPYIQRTFPNREMGRYKRISFCHRQKFPPKLIKKNRTLRASFCLVHSGLDS